MTEEQKKKELLRIYAKLYYKENKEKNNDKRKKLYQEQKAKVKELMEKNTDVKLTTESALMFLRNTEILTKTGKIKSKAVVDKLDQIIGLMTEIKNRGASSTI